MGLFYCQKSEFISSLNKPFLFYRGIMQIHFIKPNEKAPIMYLVKIDKTGKLTHGCALFKSIIVEYETCVTMRQECVLKKVIDSALFITELKLSDITAAMEDKRLFNLSSFLKAHWGNYGNKD